MRQFLMVIAVVLACICCAPAPAEAGPLRFVARKVAAAGRATCRVVTAPARFVGRRCCFRSHYRVRGQCGAACK